MGHTPHDIMYQAWLQYLNDNLSAVNALHRQVWLPHLAAYEQQFTAKKHAALDEYARVGGTAVGNPDVTRRLATDVTPGMNRSIHLFVPRHASREMFEQLFMKAADANLASGKRAVDTAVMHADWVFDRVRSRLPLHLWGTKSVADVGEEIQNAKKKALVGGIVRQEMQVSTPKINNTPLP